MAIIIIATGDLHFILHYPEVSYLDEPQQRIMHKRMGGMGFAIMFICNFKKEWLAVFLYGEWEIFYADIHYSTILTIDCNSEFR